MDARHLQNMKAKISLYVMMLALVLSACINGAAAPASAPGADAPGYQIELTTNPSQPAVGDSEIIVDVKDNKGMPVADAIVRLNAGMSGAMNHGDINGRADNKGGGKYGTRLKFSMAGEWNFTVTIERQNQPKFNKDLKVMVKS